jgi:serine/threonine protein kinase
MVGVSPGQVLANRYRLTEHIAGGGMGDVWRGTDEVLDRTVAVKILLPALLAEPGFATRFRDEARTMATISHPGVVNVYDYGTDSGVTYLVMEYVEGDPLSRTLTRVGRLTPARTMSLIAQAADALQAAHDKGIVHRDVKPANLLVRPNGTLVLTDFGIARRQAAATHLTVAGSVLGTASYISPEQASGQGATAASDIYSLGVVAYQCLAGHRPFEGDGPVEIALQHVEAAPPPLPPDVPRAARAVVERCMAKQPSARFPSASALAAAARAASGGQAPPPASAGTRTQPVAQGNGPAKTQVLPRSQGGAPVQRRAVPTAEDLRPGTGSGRARVVILGVILAILVMLLSGLIASWLKRTGRLSAPAPATHTVAAAAMPAHRTTASPDRAVAPPGSAAVQAPDRRVVQGTVAGTVMVDGGPTT